MSFQFFLSSLIICRVLLKIKNSSHSESFQIVGLNSWKEQHNKNRYTRLELRKEISIEPDSFFYLVFEQTLKEAITDVFQSIFTLFLQSNVHLL